MRGNQRVNGGNFIPHTDLPVPSITAGTQLFFTDDSHTGSSFLNGEETIAWTVPSGGLSAGQVVVANDVAGFATFDIAGGGTSTAMLGLNANGDNLFVLEGTDRSGSPLFGINFAIASAWKTTGGATLSSSYLIPALNVTGGNLDVSTESTLDNGQYTGPKMFASVALAKASVFDLNNWSFSDNLVTFALDSTDFSIPVPEPSSLALLLSGALAMFVVRRLRR